jgi:CRISPR-associated exonuclease Cas4
LTVEGKLLHERVDDPFFTEVRKDLVIARSVPVASYRLGLSGICDVVEFTRSPHGIALRDREGFYLPAPIEYKRGRPKRDPIDEAQLCAQAMCLEEMLLVQIPKGYLYYGQTRHRLEVEFSSQLRNLVVEAAAEMHAYFSRGYTPRVKPSKACRSCSLVDKCLPQLQTEAQSASQYIQQQIREE